MMRKKALFFLLFSLLMATDLWAQNTNEKSIFLFFEPKKYKVVSLSMPEFKDFKRLYSSAFITKVNQYEISLQYKIRKGYNIQSIKDMGLVCYKNDGTRSYRSGTEKDNDCSIKVRSISSSLVFLTITARTDVFYIMLHKPNTAIEPKNSYTRLQYYSVTNEGYNIWKNKTQYIVKYKNYPPIIDPTGMAFEGMPSTFPEKQENWEVINPSFNEKQAITPQKMNVIGEVNKDDYILETDPPKSEEKAPISQVNIVPETQNQEKLQPCDVSSGCAIQKKAEPEKMGTKAEVTYQLKPTPKKDEQDAVESCDSSCQDEDDSDDQDDDTQSTKKEVKVPTKEEETSMQETYPPSDIHQGNDPYQDKEDQYKPVPPEAKKRLEYKDGEIVHDKLPKEKDHSEVDGQIIFFQTEKEHHAIFDEEELDKVDLSKTGADGNYDEDYKNDPGNATHEDDTVNDCPPDSNTQTADSGSNSSHPQQTNDDQEESDD